MNADAVERAALVDLLPHPVVRLDDRGRLLFANRAFREVTGLSVDDGQPRPFADFVHEDDRAGIPSPSGIPGHSARAHLRIRALSGWISMLARAVALSAVDGGGLLLSMEPVSSGTSTTPGAMEILDLIPAPLLLVDRKLKVVAANAHARLELRLRGVDDRAEDITSEAAARLGEDYVDRFTRGLAEGIASMGAANGAGSTLVDLSTPERRVVIRLIPSPNLLLGAVRPVLLTNVTDEVLVAEEAERTRREAQIASAALRSAERMAHLGVWTIDARTWEQEWSDENYRIFGFEPGGISPTTETVLAAVHPEDRDTLSQAFADVVSTGTSSALVRVIRRDGSIRYMYNEAVAVYDEAGALLAVQGISQDVTDREHLWLQLNRTESLLLEAQRVAHLGNWTRDLRTNEVEVSDEVLRICNLSPDTPEHLLTALQGMIHPEDADRTHAVIADAIQAGRPWVVTHRLLLADGTVKWAEQRGVVEVDDAGAAVRVAGTIQDVTDRERAAQELRESRARLAEAQRVARIGSWSLDLVTGHLDWSDEIYRIFEIDPQRFEASYEAFLALVHPDDRERVDHAYTQSLQDRAPYSVTHRLLFPGGRVKWVEERAESDFAADGTPLVSRGTVQDVTEREHMVIALREAEAKFSAIFQNAPVGMAIRRVSDDRLIDVNAATEQMFGARREHMIGKTIPELGVYMTPDDRVPVKDMVDRGEGFTGRPMQWRRPDGSTMHALLSMQAVDIAGERFAIASLADTARIVEAEEAQRILAARFSGLMMSSGDGILINDSQMRFVDANPAVTDMLGYSREQLLQMRVPDVVETWDPAFDSEEAFRRAVEDSHGEGRIYLFRTAEGGTRWLSLSASWVDDSTVIAVVRDVHDEYLEASAARELAEVVAAAPLSIVTSDATGVILTVNPETERMFAWSSGDLVGRNIAVLTAGLADGDHDRFIKHYLRTGEASTPEGKVIGRTREVRARRSDGTEFPADLTVAEFAEPNGSHRFVAILSDRSDWHAKDEQIRRMQRLEAVGVLAAGIAHDFNNLLTGISGGIDLARDQPGEPRWLDVADKSAKRAAELVRSLLRFARREEPLRARVAPGEIVAATLELARATFDRRVWIESEVSGQLPDLDADRGQLEQVLLNLMVNARDAVLERAAEASGEYRPTVRIDVAATPSGERSGIQIAVRDNGTGMTDEVRARAFDPFFTTKPVDRGTGLGLATVVGLVEGHGGSVGIESSPGVGTTVVVWLPAMDNDDEHALRPVSGSRHAVAPHDETSAYRVLVVDDEEAVGSIAEAFLVAAGYEVTRVSDGAAAVELVRARPFDLVVTDLNMPAPDGWAVLAAVREHAAGTPVIIVSGHAEDEEVRRRGAFAHLPKPFDRASLMEIVGQAVARGSQ